MTSIADESVIIQSTSESVPSTPCWFGEVALMAAYLRKHGILMDWSSLANNWLNSITNKSESRFSPCSGAG
jgi:hypothetical protein